MQTTKLPPILRLVMTRKITILTTMTFLVGLMMIAITMDANATPGPCGVGHTDNGDGTCTYGYVAASDDWHVYDAGNASSTCDATFTKARGTNYLQLPTSGSSTTNCFITIAEFPIDTISDLAIIDDVIMRYDVTFSSTPRNCDYVDVEVSSFDDGTGATHWANVTSSGTPFLTDDAGCASGVANDYTADLGSSGNTDLQNDLPSDVFVVGTQFNSMTRDSTLHELIFANYELQVTYTPPTQEQLDIIELQSQVIDLQSQITSVNGSLNTLDTEVSVIDTLVDYIDTWLWNLII